MQQSALGGQKQPAAGRGYLQFLKCSFPQGWNCLTSKSMPGCASMKTLPAARRTTRSGSRGALCTRSALPQLAFGTPSGAIIARLRTDATSNPNSVDGGI